MTCGSTSQVGDQRVLRSEPRVGREHDTGVAANPSVGGVAPCHLDAPDEAVLEEAAEGTVSTLSALSCTASLLTSGGLQAELVLAHAVTLRSPTSAGFAMSSNLRTTARTSTFESAGAQSRSSSRQLPFA